MKTKLLGTAIAFAFAATPLASLAGGVSGGMLTRSGPSTDGKTTHTRSSKMMDTVVLIQLIRSILLLALIFELVT